MANGVLLTTPTMLIALLRTVALGWRQETMADNAREVQKLGAELYDRLRVMSGHMQTLQRSLTSSVRPTTRRSALSSPACWCRPGSSRASACKAVRRARGAGPDRVGAPPFAGLPTRAARRRVRAADDRGTARRRHGHGRQHRHV